MKRVSTFLAALLCTVAATFADAPFRNHRYDVFKVLPVNSEQTVFIGNSITNMHEWWEAFGDHNVVNRGVSGAVTDEALANIEAIAAGRPKKVFLMLGTNDLGTAGINTTEHVVANVALMVDRLQAVSPTTELYIQSILPSGKRDQALQQATNTALEALCKTKGVTYINLWDDLKGVATNSNGLSYDNLHLTANAYKIWCDKVAPYVTGNSSSVYTDAVQQDGGLGASHGMRATIFSKLPIGNDDILIIGDEMVHGGEWHELLRSSRVKSRGTGWGYAGMSLTNMSKMIEPIFHGGATPAQVYLHIGVDDVVFQTTELATILANYKAAVAKIQQLSPTTEVVMTSVQPMSNAAKNTERVVPFNALLKAYADEDTTDKLHYLDIYTDFVTDAGTANTALFTGNYLYGKGYVKVAQKLEAQIKALDANAAVTAITDAEAEALYTRFTNRTALGNAIVQASLLPEGNGVGYYKTADMVDVKSQIAAAYMALRNSTSSTDVFTSQVEALSTAVNALLPKLNQPTVSTGENEVWYQLSTPNRGSRYLTSTGAGEGVIGEEKHNYATGMWKFVERTDGKLNIVNRHDNSYLAPTAAYNTQIMTSATQPTNGWTLSHANTAGLFIVSSGTVQLNQTQQGLGYKVYNWSSGQNGTDRTDAGCQYLVTLVTDEPDALPEPAESSKCYLAAHTKQSNGTYVNRYLYVNENGTLANNTEFMLDNDSYVWELIPNGTDAWHIKNGTGKYLSYGPRLIVADTPYSFQFKDDAVDKSSEAKSLYNPTSSGGKYMVLAADGSRFDQYGQPVNNGSWCSDYILTSTSDITGYTLSVVSNLSSAEPLFSWNGEEFATSTILVEGTKVTDSTLDMVSHHTAYRFDGFYSDAAYTQPLGTTCTIAELTGNRTVYAKFSLLIFSASTAETDLVPVQIYNNRSKEYTIRLNESSSYNGKPINSAVNAYSENDIWYLVGDASSFKMYSRMAGTELGLKLASNNRDAAATMAPVSEATALTLVEQVGSFAICPVGATGQSLNMHGGNGHDIKLYNTADGGSTWLFNLLNQQPLTITYNTSLEGGYETNTRIAEVAISVNGTTGNSRWTKESVLTKQDYYLPVGATFSMTAATVYHGWEVDFNGATGIPEQVLPEEGYHATVNISVDTDNAYQYLFYSNDPVMNRPYRIPAIAVNRQGTVLAVTDHRPGGNDVGFAEVDIKIRRSEDYVNWTEEEFVVNGTGSGREVNGTWVNNVFEYAFGDAAIVADRESDEVLIMCVGGKQSFPGGTATSHNYVAKLKSHDGGLTWDEPHNLTAMFMEVSQMAMENIEGYTPILPEAYSMFYGSGRILQSRIFKKEDSQYYRIYAALLVREPYNGGVSHNNHVVYSDDFGDTWHTLGGVAVPGGDEAKVEELPDGTIVISSRKSYGRYFNIFTFTDIATGQGKWATSVASHNQTGGIAFGANACNGELIKIPVIRKNDGIKCDIMLQSVPTGDKREKVTIYYKEMNYSKAYTPMTFAQNWTKGLQVTDRGSAYSTMTVQADGRIGFFYEEEPNGYCMVYVPLTIEEITGGAYIINEEATGTETPQIESLHAAYPMVYDLMGRRVDAATHEGPHIVVRQDGTTIKVYKHTKQ